jgi:hypothetical protein
MIMEHHAGDRPAAAGAGWHGSARRDRPTRSAVIMVGRVIAEDHADAHPPAAPGSRTSS